MNKKYTWQQFELAMKFAAGLYKTKFDYIIGIPRGGLMLAVRLSHLLNVPVMPLERIIKPKGNVSHSYIIANKKVLIVDDIYDSGKTIRHTLSKLTNVDNPPHIQIFVWLMREGSLNDRMDFHLRYHEVIAGNCRNSTKIWAEFPWERKVR